MVESVSFEKVRLSNTVNADYMKVFFSNFVVKFSQDSLLYFPILCKL